MKQQSQRQRLIERIRALEKITAIGLCCIIHQCPFCARCKKVGLKLWLDEIKGRHQDESFPSSVDPENQQLLCEDCHRLKTEGEEGVHVDYLQRANPEVKAGMVTFSREIKSRLPDLTGTHLKQNLKDILKAVRAAGKVNYADVR